MLKKPNMRVNINEHMHIHITTTTIISCVFKIESL